MGILGLTRRQNLTSTGGFRLSGDSVVNGLRLFKAALEAEHTNFQGEPWLGDWLNREHVRGSMIYVAAKINYNKNMASGIDGAPFDQGTRSEIVGRFNFWVAETIERAEQYRSSSRTANAVEAWVAETEAFKNDPVNSY